MATRVMLVTSEGACGIAEHSELLMAAVHAAEPEVLIEPLYDLDPQAFFVDEWERSRPRPDLLHLNYHAALHSRWTPEQVQRVQTACGIPVLITYHDSGLPNTDQCKDLHAVADAFVVHEPAEDLPGAIYWRQGVPAAARDSYMYLAADAHLGGDRIARFKQYHAQPVLGTVGFPFGWKNLDLLASATAAAGWALVLLAPTAAADDLARWQGLNPHTLVRTDFVPREAVVAHLAGCDATAFLYTCANAGTSGAIRQGLAARKPVLASPPGVCRQFRDLALTYGDPSHRLSPITWVVPEPDRVIAALRQVQITRVDPGVCWVAEQDSWTGLGRRYAALYRKLHEDRGHGHSCD